MKHFEGRVAFITGGASGIGLGMARAFLEEGMKVVIADRNAAHLETARGVLGGSNAVHFASLDVADRAQFRAVADDALRTFGKIHVLCNNAGVGGGGEVPDAGFDEWDAALAINFGGVVNGIKALVPAIRAHGEGGHVVNTSSMAGLVPLPGLGAYMTAKFAVRGLTESLRMSLAPEGIGVSCLYPGATRTNLLSLPEGEAVSADPLLTALADALRVAMDPLDMGREVVAAIRENRAHILTHAEFADELAARNRALEAGFPAGDEVPEARVRFEGMRRARVDELLGMAAKD